MLSMFTPDSGRALSRLSKTKRRSFAHGFTPARVALGHNLNQIEKPMIPSGENQAARPTEGSGRTIRMRLLRDCSPASY